MHQPDAQPYKNAKTNGRAVRYVTNTTAIRRIRLDYLSDNALAELKRALQGHEPTDSTSVSLITRRALRLYREKVVALPPDGLESERQEVRELSKLPNPQRSRHDDSKAHFAFMTQRMKAAREAVGPTRTPLKAHRTTPTRHSHTPNERTT